MRALVSLALGLAAVVAAACSGPGGRRPRPVPPPAPDGLPALRGDPTPRSDRRASYRIVASLDAAARRVTGRETLTWIHGGVAPVAEVPLHLYMNGFKNETSVFLRESRGEHRAARMPDDGWGWIEVRSIVPAGGGADLRPGARAGEDETILVVPLPAPVAPGGTVALELEFTTQLPAAFARTGYAGEFLMVGQWFPKIAVLETRGGEQAWRAEPFHALSEFYADFGVYDVVLEVPDTHVVAATGVLAEVAPAGPGRRRLRYRAEDVHDFAWAADPYLEVLEGKSGDGVLVRVYHRPEQARFARRHLVAAARTLEIFGELFGPYPWSIMSVIDVPLEAGESAGGMEYPTLVTTTGDSLFTPAGVRVPEFTTVHEVGHNWFQGLLASDEVREPWLDEGLNEYAGGLVFDRWLGADAGLVELGEARAGYYPVHEVLGGTGYFPVPAAAVSHAFPDMGSYGQVVYGKTAVALKTLEGIVGRDRFVAALGAYARRFAFRHPTAEDLIDTLEAELGEELRWFLEPALRGTGAIDLRAGPIVARPVRPPAGVFGEGDGRRAEAPRAPARPEWESEVVITNTGGVPCAVEVELAFADGARIRERWDGRAGFTRLVRRHPTPLVEVRVDPDGKVALEIDRLDNERRTRPARRPAARAAARAAFWEQTLLQLLGL